MSYALRVADRVVAFRQRTDALNRRVYLCVGVPPFQSEHAVLQYLRLPTALGIPPAGMRLAYQIMPHEATAARARIAAEIPRARSPLIGLQVASFPTKAYRDWPIGNFAELAERIVATWPQSHLLIYGGSEERSRALWLKEQLGDRATLYAGALTLRETAALMSCTDLYVGVDTGPAASSSDPFRVDVTHLVAAGNDLDRRRESHASGPCANAARSAAMT